MPAFVDTVDRVIQTLNIKTFSLGGSSMGGNVAWNYARAHPNKLTSMILIDPSGAPYPDKPPPPIVFRVAQSPVFQPALLYVTLRWLVAAAALSSVANPVDVQRGIDNAHLGTVALCGQPATHD